MTDPREPRIQTGARIKKTLRAKIDALAREERRNRSQMVEVLLAEAIERRQTARVS
jgi:metal-responsive CopG/Arc/MetJ family transcriptional regulator